jgi:nicotinate-nucleotide pyrophosphorylase (carboxylating)
MNLSKSETRTDRLESALFRGHALSLQNPKYLEAVYLVTEALLERDLADGDLTAKALGVPTGSAAAVIVARESGVLAGMEELALHLRTRGIQVHLGKADGDWFASGDPLAYLEGERANLLALERVGLNLVQRLSGIATAARTLQASIQEMGSSARIVGTRKTPWGLVDKRALHLAGCGTHRLNLADAILIKNNHLTLLANREEEAVVPAIEKAWEHRRDSAFIEVEVRTKDAARQAARTFCRLEEADEGYPCLLMLDNMHPMEVTEVLEMLWRERLWESTLVEASGGITEPAVARYAASGVDAISIGALTHSVRALDLCQRWC